VIGTAGGIGAVLGDAAALRVKPRRPLFAGSLAVSLWALEPALLARPASTWSIAAAAALGFGAMTFSNALWFTALQERIPPETLSRVSSYDWLGSIVIQPVGYALAGPVSAAIGMSATLLAGAALHGFACIGVALTPEIRRLKRPG
jgi:predicted MFS family arabinose efflux permease